MQLRSLASLQGGGSRLETQQSRCYSLGVEAVCSVFLPHWGRLVFVLFRSSPDWTRPTHTMEHDLLLLKVN